MLWPGSLKDKFLYEVLMDFKYCPEVLKGSPKGSLPEIAEVETI